MSSKKVALVIDKDGERKVIGDGVMDLDAEGRQYLDFSGVVTDPAYRLNLTEKDRISINVTPFCSEAEEGK